MSNSVEELISNNSLEEETYQTPRLSVCKVNWRAIIKEPQEDCFLPGIIVGISHHGTVIRMTNQLQKKSHYALLIKAYLNDNKYLIYAKAEVDYISLSKNFYRHGFLFTQIKSKDQELLAAFSEGLI